MTKEYIFEFSGLIDVSDNTKELINEVVRIVGGSQGHIEGNKLRIVI